MQSPLEQPKANARIMDLVMHGDEMTWQQLLFDLVKTQQMDPWDVNLTTLCEEFLVAVRHMTQTNFRLNGKIVLATAMLLKIKTSALLDHDINALDTLLASQDEQDMALDLEDGPQGRQRIHVDNLPRVYPKTPQPRQRQVSIYDLVEALEQALEVNVRRQRRILFSHPEVRIPERSIDLHGAMDTVYGRVREHYDSGKQEQLTFQQLTAGADKTAVIYTFMPLLHLTTARKTDMDQPEHFSTIYITLAQAGLEAAPGVQVGEMPTGETVEGEA